MISGLIKRFKYWRYREEHGVAHPREIHELGAWNDFCDHLRSGGIGRRHIEMAGRYGMGESLQEIADTFNVTRERVRQCVMKYYRQKLRGENPNETRFKSQTANDEF